jgi:hypothetical protein
LLLPSDLSFLVRQRQAKAYRTSVEQLPEA